MKRGDEEDRQGLPYELEKQNVTAKISMKKLFIKNVSQGRPSIK